MRGVFFRGLACWSSLYLSIILIINVTTAINSKINFWSWSTFFYSSIKNKSWWRQILLFSYIFDKRFKFKSHKTIIKTMGTAKNNCCVVARSFYTFLNSSHLNVSRFKCFANFMLIEIGLNFSCLPEMVEFQVFSEENLVQEQLWKYQSRIFLALLKLFYSTLPSCIRVNNHCKQSLTRAMTESFLMCNWLDLTNVSS